MSIPSLRIAALAAAGALALALSACTPEAEPSPEPTPTASAAPIFASDDEALAAAVEAYEAYASMSGSIASDGGDDAERIDPYVTAEFAGNVGSEFDALRSAGGHTQGQTTFDTASLVERTEIDDIASVSIYLCRDVSGVRVIDADGIDVTPKDRLERIPSKAELVSKSTDEPSILVVDGISQWSGSDFC
ncbi:hypothetical protein [Agromyces sp. NPDC058104]|uniref:hypothetical protein n=1 Tax=Agromyces sp. NPDC058104 TaxID=3346342 RepID=UPI0036D8DCCF